MSDEIILYPDAEDADWIRALPVPEEKALSHAEMTFLADPPVPTSQPSGQPAESPYKEEEHPRDALGKFSKKAPKPNRVAHKKIPPGVMERSMEAPSPLQAMMNRTIAYLGQINLSVTAVEVRIADANDQERMGDFDAYAEPGVVMFSPRVAAEYVRLARLQAQGRRLGYDNYRRATLVLHEALHQVQGAKEWAAPGDSWRAGSDLEEGIVEAIAVDLTENYVKKTFGKAQMDYGAPGIGDTFYKDQVAEVRKRSMRATGQSWHSPAAFAWRVSMLRRSFADRRVEWDRVASLPMPQFDRNGQVKLADWKPLLHPRTIGGRFRRSFMHPVAEQHPTGTNSAYQLVIPSDDPDVTKIGAQLVSAERHARMFGAARGKLTRLSNQARSISQVSEDAIAAYGFVAGKYGGKIPKLIARLHRTQERRISILEALRDNPDRDPAGELVPNLLDPEIWNSLTVSDCRLHASHASVADLLACERRWNRPEVMFDRAHHEEEFTKWLVIHNEIERRAARKKKPRKVPTKIHVNEYGVELPSDDPEIRKLAMEIFHAEQHARIYGMSRTGTFERSQEVKKNRSLYELLQDTVKAYGISAGRNGAKLPKLAFLLNERQEKRIEELRKMLGVGVTLSWDEIEHPRGGHGRFRRKGSTLWKIAQAEGGFTYDPVTGDVPDHGYAVSVRPEHEVALPEGKVTGAQIEEYIAACKEDFEGDSMAYLGAWIADGKLFLDVTTVAEDEDTAARIGRQAGQYAMFNLGTFEEVPLWEDESAVERARRIAQVQGLQAGEDDLPPGLDAAADRGRDQREAGRDEELDLGPLARLNWKASLHPRGTGGRFRQTPDAPKYTVGGVATDPDDYEPPDDYDYGDGPDELSAVEGLDDLRRLLGIELPETEYTPSQWNPWHPSTLDPEDYWKPSMKKGVTDENKEDWAKLVNIWMRTIDPKMESNWSGNITTDKLDQTRNHQAYGVTQNDTGDIDLSSQILPPFDDWIPGEDNDPRRAALYAIFHEMAHTFSAAQIWREYARQEDIDLDGVEGEQVQDSEEVQTIMDRWTSEANSAKGLEEHEEAAADLLTRAYFEDFVKFVTEHGGHNKADLHAWFWNNHSYGPRVADLVYTGEVLGYDRKTWARKMFTIPALQRGQTILDEVRKAESLRAANPGMTDDGRVKFARSLIAPHVPLTAEMAMTPVPDELLPDMKAMFGAFWTSIDGEHTPLEDHLPGALVLSPASKVIDKLQDPVMWPRAKANVT